MATRQQIFFNGYKALTVTKVTLRYLKREITLCDFSHGISTYGLSLLWWHFMSWLVEHGRIFPNNAGLHVVHLVYASFSAHGLNTRRPTKTKSLCLYCMDFSWPSTHNLCIMRMNKQSSARNVTISNELNQVCLHLHLVLLYFTAFISKQFAVKE